MTHAEIAQLWKLLGQTWGAKFLEQYGTKPNDAWSAMLAGVTPEGARAAFAGLVQAGSPFPPTLPEFVAEARKWGRERAKQQQADARLLPATTVSEEQARANLERLRAAMRG